MSTIGWLFIFAAFYLFRAVFKGQVFDTEGNFTLPENAEKELTAIITGDTSTLKTLDQMGPAGLNAPAPPSGSDSTTAGADGTGDPSTLAALSLTGTPDGWAKLNERTPAQAVAWATSQKSYPQGYCERFVTVAYRGHPGGFATARAHALAMKLNKGTPPAGALVFIKSGNPAWHVCMSVGGGRIVSTDFDGTQHRAGVVGIGTLEAISKWGPYLGWSAPVFK